MNCTQKSKARQAVEQSLFLIFLSLILAFTINQFRPDGGLKLSGDWPNENRTVQTGVDALNIALEEARELFKSKKATFVDARAEAQYSRGHIQGSVCLPWMKVDEAFFDVAEKLDPQKPIITYCDGEACDSGRQLALFLKDMGYSRARVLADGWRLWLGAGLPVSSKAGKIQGQES